MSPTTNYYESVAAIIWTWFLLFLLICQLKMIVAPNVCCIFPKYTKVKEEKLCRRLNQKRNLIRICINPIFQFSKNGSTTLFPPFTRLKSLATRMTLISVACLLHTEARHFTDGAGLFCLKFRVRKQDCLDARLVAYLRHLGCYLQ